MEAQDIVRRNRKCPEFLRVVCRVTERVTEYEFSGINLHELPACCQSRHSALS
jgi:hypothetical protein